MVSVTDVGGEEAWKCLICQKVQQALNHPHKAKTSVADPDPGSGAFLTPGSGIRNRFFPDPGSQTHTFESLVTIFGQKVL
jgi:hypothetical protein